MIFAEVFYNGKRLYRRPLDDPSVQEALAVQAYQLQTFGNTTYSVNYENIEDDMYIFVAVDLHNLPERLRQVRKIRKMTLTEAAKQAATSASFLSDIELGKTSPSLNTLSKLAVVYRASIEVNFYGLTEQEQDELRFGEAIKSLSNKPFDPALPLAPDRKK